MRWTLASVLPYALAVSMISCAKPEAPPKTTPATQTRQPEAAPDKDPSSEGVVVFASDSPQLRQIGVAPVRLEDVPVDEVTAPAKIQVNPNRISHAALPVPGKIVRVMARLGDAVKQGQPMVTIESPSLGEAESGYLQSESGLHQAEVAVKKADADLSRLTLLFEHGATAQKELQSAQTAAVLARSGVDQARSVRAQARQKLELLGLKPGQFQQQATVAAPISGKVLEINVTEGEYRNDANAPLFTIADLSRVWVSSDVPESAIRFYRIGGLVEVNLIAFPDETLHARVTRIADTVDAETRTIKVTAELDNPGGRLRPQMFGRLRYAASTAPTLWVPEASIVQLSGKDVVFVEETPGRFLATPVTLGKRHDGGFVVLKGLSSGRRIVTTGAVYVKARL